MFIKEKKKSMTQSFHSRNFNENENCFSRFHGLHCPRTNKYTITSSMVSVHLEGDWTMIIYRIEAGVNQKKKQAQRHLQVQGGLVLWENWK